MYLFQENEPRAVFVARSFFLVPSKNGFTYFPSMGAGAGASALVSTRLNAVSKRAVTASKSHPIIAPKVSWGITAVTSSLSAKGGTQSATYSGGGGSVNVVAGYAT